MPPNKLLPESVFVLGALDPEMREIMHVLRDAGFRYLRAAKDGVRVSTRSAYEANGVLRPSRFLGRPGVLAPQERAVYVECTVRGHDPLLRVDHHHPGDPGYAMPPERYLEGASIGQTLQLLGREATPTQRLLAAADHCLTAAYQGECPGVDPKELLFLRAAWRAKVSGRSLTDVLDGVLHAAREVLRRYDPAQAESVFTDPMQSLPDLAEGAAYAGRAVRYREWFPEGSLKEMLKGASAAHIERFMTRHREAGREVYGNPFRGYAGAYLA